MKSEDFGALIVIVWLLCVLLAICGWILNIVKLFGLWDLPINGEFVIRCVGVFIAPIGAIAGYI